MESAMDGNPLARQGRAHRTDSANQGPSVRGRTPVRPLGFFRLEHFRKNLLSDQPRHIHAITGWFRAGRIMVGDAHDGVDAFREMRRRQARTQDNEHLVVDAEVSTVHASAFFVLAQAGGYLRAR